MKFYRPIPNMPLPLLASTDLDLHGNVPVTPFTIAVLSLHNKETRHITSLVVTNGSKGAKGGQSGAGKFLVAKGNPFLDCNIKREKKSEPAGRHFSCHEQMNSLSFPPLSFLHRINSIA
jgi:hypothetical protein